MNKPNPYYYSLQQMVIGLAQIERNHYLAGTNKKEDDIVHSFSVALLCWFIHDNYKINLDIGEILKYALVHDFVELYAGDVNTFASKAEREHKAEKEALALQQMTEEFSEFSDMTKLMRQYEEKTSEEALFVWTVDKMQQLIMGDLDTWRPYKNLSINFESFSKKYQELLEKCSPYCKEIFAGLIEYSKTTYYDQPV